ncbi:MAG TPA: M1 family aminopeptidase [Kofleriaceae bacterium]|nr:M1 family aminopeptidase [Kofleriaceae bacterium]
MRRSVPILILALGACGGGDQEEHPTGPAAVTVLHYDYAFDLESRAAAVVATLRVDAPGDCVSLPMRAGGLEDVLLGGEPITDGALEDGVLSACGRGWEAGEEVALEAHMVVALETWGDSQVGYSVATDAEGAPFHYLVSWVGGCDRFGPCDRAPDRFATYRFTVSHPPGVQVLCPGALSPGEGETVCDLGLAAPTYSAFGLAAGPSWVEVPLGDWGGIAATLHDMPAVDMAPAIDADAHARFVAWMSERFGPYPYGDALRLFVGPTYWSGFEHPGNIALSDTLHLAPSSYADAVTHVINHEIAHQWAGDHTTLASERDFVWKEAMAEYLSFVFEEEALSAEDGLATARAWKAFARGAAFHPVPDEEDAPLLDWYGDVYGPGPMILFRQLEGLFGREAVLAAIAELIGGEEPAARSVDDVRAALEAATGADLAGYFDTWIHGGGAPTWPVFEVTWTQTRAGPLTYTVRQSAPAAPLHGCAFSVAFTRDAQRAEAWIDLGVDGAAEVTGTIEPGFRATAAVLDPDGHCLAYAPAAAAAPVRRRNPWVVQERACSPGTGTSSMPSTRSSSCSR